MCVKHYIKTILTYTLKILKQRLNSLSNNQDSVVQAQFFPLFSLHGYSNWISESLSTASGTWLYGLPPLKTGEGCATPPPMGEQQAQ